MRYITVIFENEDIIDYVSKNDQMISEAAVYIASFRPALVDYVFENLQDFIEEDDLVATYENIKAFIISENLYLYEVVSDILASTELTLEEKHILLLENPLGWVGKSISKHMPNTGQYIDSAVDKFSNSIVGKSTKFIKNGVDVSSDYISNTKLGKNILNSKIKKNLVRGGVLLSLASLYDVPYAKDAIPVATNTVKYGIGLGAAGLIGTGAYSAHKRLNRTP